MELPIGSHNPTVTAWLQMLAAFEDRTNTRTTQVVVVQLNQVHMRQQHSLRSSLPGEGRLQLIIKKLSLIPTSHSIFVTQLTKLDMHVCYSWYWSRTLDGVGATSFQPPTAILAASKGGPERAMQVDL